MSSKLLTTQEAARILGFSDSRLRQLIAIGRAKPTQRIGKSWVFSLKAIERIRTRHKGKIG